METGAGRKRLDVRGVRRGAGGVNRLEHTRTPTTEAVEATRYVETGGKPGNVVPCVTGAAPGRRPELTTDP